LPVASATAQVSPPGTSARSGASRRRSTPLTLRAICNEGKALCRDPSLSG
jgi:hypothetical protein